MALFLITSMSYFSVAYADDLSSVENTNVADESEGRGTLENSIIGDSPENAAIGFQDTIVSIDGDGGKSEPEHQSTIDGKTSYALDDPNQGSINGIHEANLEENGVSDKLDDSPNGWVTDGDVVKYYIDGSFAVGELYVDGAWRYFDPVTGQMATGLTDIGYKTVLYGEDGRMLYGLQDAEGLGARFFDEVTGEMATAALVSSSDGALYYAGSDGALATGERFISGGWYYFCPVNNAAATGLTDIGYKTVLYGADGRMLYGEQREGGAWRYFDPVTGQMATGLTDIGYKTVLYGEDGRMLYGLQDAEGLGARFFDEVTGEMATAKWVAYDAGLSAFADDFGAFVFWARVGNTGYLVTNQEGDVQHGFLFSGKYAIHANLESGMLDFGWFLDSNNEYCYANENTGLLVSGEAALRNSPLDYGAYHWFYFDSSSYSLAHGWRYLGAQGKWVYYDDGGGWMLYGQQRLHANSSDQDRHWYYFDEETGAVQYGFKWIRPQHKVVYYDLIYGWMLYGWHSINNYAYCFDATDGHLAAVDAGDSRISRYTNWMIDIALDDSHGYDQAYRWGERGDYDCSSLVISALKASGLNTGSATYTGNMRSQLTARGFKWMTDFSELRPGDILLNEVYHTAIYLGNNLLVHASGNEFDDAVGGKPGDQTGEEIYIRTYYWRPWDGFLRIA